MTGAAAAGTENDINTLLLELFGNLRSCLLTELLNISAASHEGVCLICQRSDESGVDKLMETVDREHCIDVLVDI